jgi:hypothetical protein
MPSWTVSARKNGGWIQELESGKVEFDSESVWHFREPGLLSQLWGSPDYLPLIEDGTIDTISTIKTYNRNFFKNNAIPDGILFIKGGDISPATESGLRRFFREKFLAWKTLPNSASRPSRKVSRCSSKSFRIIMMVSSWSSRIPS